MTPPIRHDVERGQSSTKRLRSGSREGKLQFRSSLSCRRGLPISASGGEELRPLDPRSAWTMAGQWERHCPIGRAIHSKHIQRSGQYRSWPGATARCRHEDVIVRVRRQQRPRTRRRKVPRPATPAPASRATPPANGRRSIRARLSRPEPASRSGFSLAHDDRHQAAIKGSLFPTCLFNASLDSPQPQVRSARGSSPLPVCPGAGVFNAACPLP